jgi:hypothetical protein
MISTMNQATAPLLQNGVQSRSDIPAKARGQKLARMARRLCELFYRARQAKLTDNMTMIFQPVWANWA